MKIRSLSRNPEVALTEEGPEWDYHFEKLKRFQARRGHLSVPDLYPPMETLPKWLAAQKSHISHLELAQIKRLWDLGVRFGVLDSQWLFQFFELLRAKKRFGNVNDPRIWSRKRSLRNWVSTQRTNNAKGQVLPHRAKLLEGIGFIWKPEDAAWEKRFAELLAFKAQFGHTVVPEDWPENPGLGLWLCNQRRRGGLKEEKKRRRLEDAGCFLRHDDWRWEVGFREWQEYVRVHRTTVIPLGKKYHSINAWGCIQRMKWRAGKLSLDRVRRLDAAGFSWEPKGDLWEKNFAKLVKYRKKCGDWDFLKSGRNRQLQVWCYTQRWLRRRGRLLVKRFALLDELGFPWSLRKRSVERSSSPRRPDVHRGIKANVKRRTL